jgi:outer membrane receptor for ferrienterochelin and colicins
MRLQKAAPVLLLQKPLTALHRAFTNLAYEFKGWKLDYTFNYNGRKRIPSTAMNPPVHQQASHSPAYVLMNAQVSKELGKKTCMSCIMMYPTVGVVKELSYLII